jgi:hypothetical protein
MDELQQAWREWFNKPSPLWLAFAGAQVTWRITEGEDSASAWPVLRRIGQAAPPPGEIARETFRNKNEIPK